MQWVIFLSLLSRLLFVLAFKSLIACLGQTLIPPRVVFIPPRVFWASWISRLNIPIEFWDFYATISSNVFFLSLSISSFLGLPLHEYWHSWCCSIRLWGSVHLFSFFFLSVLHIGNFYQSILKFTDSSSIMNLLMSSSSEIFILVVFFNSRISTWSF